MKNDHLKGNGKYGNSKKAAEKLISSGKIKKMYKSKYVVPWISLIESN